MPRIPVVFALVLAACSGAPPSVRIAAPLAGSVVGGNVSVHVAFGGSASRVELLVGETVAGGADVPAGAAEVALTWSAAALPDGDRAIRARAKYDGGTADSAAVNMVVDNTAPVAVLKVERLSLLSGTARIPVEVTEAHPGTVQLVEGENVHAEHCESDAAELSWTTTDCADGLHRPRLRVIDAAGNETTTDEVPVVVANRATEARITYSPAATVSVPGIWASVETDVRGWVTNPGGVRRIVSWLKWNPVSGVRLEYSVGVGLCPDRGIRFVGEESADGAIVLDLPRENVPAEAAARLPAGNSAVFPSNADPETLGTIFGHVAVMDPADHVGLQLPIEMHFLLLK